MKQNIGITAWGAVSALGVDRSTVAAAYADPRTFLQQDPADGEWRGRLPATPVPVGKLMRGNRLLQQIDRSVWLTMLAADQFRSELDWEKDETVGINIGSSRGATGLWEQYHGQFVAKDHSLLSPLASPTTTLGNLSSWLGAYLGTEGPAISHSVTCSTALQSIANAIAWLESGRCRYFIAGGSEAPLTDFTLSQMKALRIYADPEPTDFPSRSLDTAATANTMVLGEGAALFVLEADPEVSLARISGIGYAQEVPASPTAISEDGAALQRAMRQALDEAGRPSVDVVICHAPGTRKGDAAERRAIAAVFGTQIPLLTGNKWKIGHTLGASGGLSVEMALLMLEQQQFFAVPFLPDKATLPRPIEHIMINAMGFGGNAVSLIISGEGLSSTAD